MKKEYDVMAIGRACVDQIIEVDSFPSEDQKAPIANTILEGGGQASTAACLVAHLDGKAAFLGILGDDERGLFARERMEAFGVDLSGLPAPRGKTPMAYCLVSRKAHTRTILYEPLNAERLSWDEVDKDLVASARVVLVDPQGSDLLPELMAFCRSNEIPLIVDAEHAKAGWKDVFGKATVAAVSETFLKEAAPGMSAEEALIEISKAVEATCIATLGVKGAISIQDGRVMRFPAPKVEVRDTTGAGDAFHGALCLAIADGLPDIDAIRFAVAAASLSCRGLGGRSFPSRSEVDSLWPELKAEVLG